MSAGPATRLACPACGASASGPFTWRCPSAGGDDCDHRMVRTLDPSRVRFAHDGEPDPFVRYRELTHAWQVAHAAGMPDEQYVARVRALDLRIAALEGHGFAETPFRPAPALAERLGLSGAGGVWVKDETGNVAGSHKGRHLMGLALALEVAEWLDPAARAAHERHGLAIASCGNAALAAAVVARAAVRPLAVFIPPDAPAEVVRRLEAMEASITVCPRAPGEVGDPTLRAFRAAVASGAVPFCCQGSENGLTLEGGQTLAWELAAQVAGEGLAIDRLIVQVGGGALLSACVAGLREAVALGVLPRLPRIHAVQTEGGHPLERAHRLVGERITAGADAASALAHALRHRSQYMWPWETAPRSIARGILDDETYDWHAPVAAMIETGGTPLVVGEDLLREAHALAVAATGVRVGPTGAAGLAGALRLRRDGLLGAGERLVVLFTGGAHGDADPAA